MHLRALRNIASVLVFLAGCSGDGSDGKVGPGGDPFGNGGGASNGAGASGNGTGASGNGAGFAGQGGVSVCGTGTASAALSPVDMLVMFDRSRSMLDNDKWPQAASALSAFFGDAEAAGLSVALRFFPHDSPAAGCTQDGCDPVACSQVLVDIAPLLADPAPADAHEAALVSAVIAADPNVGRGGGTPMHAALDGALRWATAHQAQNPERKTVVVFVTDGEPNGCNEDFGAISGLASSALAGSDVRTYAIGLEGSNQGQMDQLAQAGGTGAGVFIGSSANAEQELLDALAKIRGEVLSCDFAVPDPADPSMPIDPSTINVTFTSGAGAAATFAQVADANACANNKSWYYDDPQSPERIFLCPSACNTVLADPNAKIEILLGCATVCGGLDQNCGDAGVPPGIPPVAPPD